MLPLPLAQHRRDPQPTQQRTQRLRIIAGVALQTLRQLPLGSGLAADRRLVEKHVHHLRDLVDVGGGHGRVQGDAVGVGQDMVLAAGLAAISGLGPVSSPPSGALANEASISARSQSIWSASLSSASRMVCNFLQTPA